MSYLVGIFITIAMQAGQPIFPHSKGELHGYVSPSGEWLIQPQFHEVSPFKDGYACVRKYKRWGVINNAGQYTVQPVYTYLGASGDIICARRGQYFGYISPLGETLIDFRFTKATDFKNSRAIIKDKNGWNFIDTKGANLLKEPSKTLTKLNPTSYLFSASSGQGIISKSGKILVPAKMASIKKITSELVLLTDSENKKTLFFFKNSVQKHFDNIRLIQPHRIIAVQKNDQWGLIDYSGQPLLRPAIDELFAFKEKMALFRIGQKYGFIDSEGAIAIKPSFTKAFSFKKGLALVQKSDDWFYIDHDGYRTAKESTSTKKATEKSTREFDTPSTNVAIIYNNNYDDNYPYYQSWNYYRNRQAAKLRYYKRNSCYNQPTRTYKRSGSSIYSPSYKNKSYSKSTQHTKRYRGSR